MISVAFCKFKTRRTKSEKKRTGRGPEAGWGGKLAVKKRETSENLTEKKLNSKIRLGKKAPQSKPVGHAKEKKQEPYGRWTFGQRCRA